MLAYWIDPVLLDSSLLLRPGAVCLGVLGATAGLVPVGSLQSQRRSRKSSCRRVPPAGLFFLPVWVQTETVNIESIFTRQRLMCGAVKCGVETSRNNPYFSRPPHGSGSVIGPG